MELPLSVNTVPIAQSLVGQEVGGMVQANATQEKLSAFTKIIVFESLKQLFPQVVPIVIKTLSANQNLEVHSKQELLLNT